MVRKSTPVSCPRHDVEADVSQAKLHRPTFQDLELAYLHCTRFIELALGSRSLHSASLEECQAPSHGAHC